MIEVLAEDDVRRIAREESQRPVFVHQRNVETVIGLPRRDYLAAAKRKAFATAKERRLVIARTSDVVRWFELRLAHRDVKPANDADAESIALARVGARRAVG